MKLMWIDPKAKQRYWDYFVSFEGYWPPGFTPRRLKRIRAACWEDERFWGDIIYRHGGHADPRDIEPCLFDHAIGNFYMLAADIAREAGIIHDA